MIRDFHLINVVCSCKYHWQIYICLCLWRIHVEALEFFTVRCSWRKDIPETQSNFLIQQGTNFRTSHDWTLGNHFAPISPSLSLPIPQEKIHLWLSDPHNLKKPHQTNFSMWSCHVSHGVSVDSVGTCRTAHSRGNTLKMQRVCNGFLRTASSMPQAADQILHAEKSPKTIRI